jgi:transposase
MRKEPVVKNAIHYVGLDVHKETIAVALCDADGRATSLGTIPNDPDSVARLMRRLREKATLRVCYEAGVCGYVLYRQLVQMGIDCIVVAPSLIPQKSGDRVKTDKKDALKLARLLRAGELVPVYVPDEAHEAVRDLVRLREDAQADLKRAKNRLGKFLLRNGFCPPPKCKAWTKPHREWLDTIYLEQPAQHLVLREHIVEVDHHCERVKRLEAALSAQIPKLPLPMQKAVLVLQCLHGVAELTAMTVVVETGELGRFKKAPQLFSYAGLVPREHSSGGPKGERRGGITKTGNTHLRRVLVEAAWHYRHPPRCAVSGPLKKRRAGQDPVAVQIAQAAHKRLHKRYWQLVQAGKPAPRAAVAVARELLGFMWAMHKTVAAAKATTAAG